MSLYDIREVQRWPGDLDGHEFPPASRLHPGVDPKTVKNYLLFTKDRMQLLLTWLLDRERELKVARDRLMEPGVVSGSPTSQEVTLHANRVLKTAQALADQMTDDGRRESARAVAEARAIREQADRYAEAVRHQAEEEGRAAAAAERARPPDPGLKTAAQLTRELARLKVQAAEARAERDVYRRHMGRIHDDMGQLIDGWARQEEGQAEMASAAGETQAATGRAS